MNRAELALADMVNNGIKKDSDCYNFVKQVLNESKHDYNHNVTEEEYLEAIETIKQYRQQIINGSELILNGRPIDKTPNQIGGKKRMIECFPNVRFYKTLNLIFDNFPDEVIGKINPKDFLKCRNVGKKSYYDFIDNLLNQ